MHLWGVSSLSNTGEGEPSLKDVISRVVSAATIVGLNVLAEAPAPVDGVWVGIPQSERRQHLVFVPVPGDYLHMLRKAWNAPIGTPQFNAGCQRLTETQYVPETRPLQRWVNTFNLHPKIQRQVKFR